MSRYFKTKETMVMTIEQPTAKELFFSAMEMKSKERQDFLLKACNGNDLLYNEVFSLIACYEQAEAFLEKPAADFAAQLILHEKDNYSLTNRSRFLEELIGKVIDNKYCIEKQLGEGGMGAVYRAIHLGTERPVAVKVITPQFMSKNEFVERFRREAKAMGRLSHPNVINVTDFGVTDFDSNKVAYLVMEYLKGLTLGQFLKEKGKLPISFAIDVLEQISSAINEAHLQGIVHRDLKPDNIWLEPDGRGSYHVKVLDFGLAKLYDNSLENQEISSIEVKKLEEKSKEKNAPFVEISVVLGEKQTQKLIVGQTTKSRLANNTSENMTRVGTILGTPLYMSPEQCQGLQTDARSDIYSLGVIAYEMFSGQTPFKGDFKELINKHLNETPEPLHKINREIPKAISDLILLALSKKTSERFPTAKAFATSLRVNFEEEKPLINQAFNIYRKNFHQIISISIVINLFFIILSALLSNIIIYNNFQFTNSFIPYFWWTFPIICLFVLGDISQGVFALAIKELQEKGKISLTHVLSTSIKYVPKILISTLNNYLLSLSEIWKLIFPAFRAHIYYSLSAPITILEELKGVQIMQRSKELLAKFYSLAFSLKVRSLLIRSVAFILFLVSFLVSIWFTNEDSGFFSNLFFTLVCTLLIPGLFIIFASPVTDMAVALLYVKAREAKGETPYQRSLSTENDIITEATRFSTRRKVYTAMSLIASIVLSGFSYLLIVPPFGEPVKITPPKFEKVEDSENAWIEYDLAIQSITPISMRLGNVANVERDSYYSLIRDNTLDLTKSSGFKGLENIVTSQASAEFNQDQLALLDKHQSALGHVLLGVKRPKAQYYLEAPNMFFTPPSVIQHRALVVVLCAQARRLHLEGKNKEAVELALASYHMSTDLARDPNAVPIQVVGAVIGRGIAAKTLIAILNSGTTDKATDLEIAREISKQDSLMPNAYQPYIQETQALNSSLRDIFIERKPVSSDGRGLNITVGETLIKLLPGLRVRFYNTYVILSQNYSERIRPSVENWDFPGAFAASNPKAMELPSYLFPIEVLTHYAFSEGLHPYALGTMKPLYLSCSFGSALASFAACSAYKKDKGEFPTTLELAMKEANLSTPMDLATKEAIGYRLENNNPVVWFAGVDGKNDNGQVAYKSPKQGVPEQGKDVIFVYGTMPLQE